MMRRYKKKPVEVSAIQFLGNSIEECVALTNEKIFSDFFKIYKKDSEGRITDQFAGKINTPEGLMTCSPTDWIVRGIAGEYYPVKHDIFIETYEPVWG